VLLDQFVRRQAAKELERRFTHAELAAHFRDRNCPLSPFYFGSVLREVTKLSARTRRRCGNL